MAETAMPPLTVPPHDRDRCGRQPQHFTIKTAAARPKDAGLIERVVRRQILVRQHANLCIDHSPAAAQLEIDF
jgi:hypothetical protein